MRKFEIETKPYGEERIYSRKSVEIEPGVTVLVGCNGSGKTTLMQWMRTDLKRKREIPYIKFDNLHDGGSKAISAALFHEDFALAATSTCSSEGENISMNIVQLSKKVAHFMKYGVVEDKFSSLNKLMDEIARDEDEGNPRRKKAGKKKDGFCWMPLIADIY